MKKKQLKQVQNQAQEGRSMVEMLGVLAIIGVLSIGGIAGYRWGMDKHITNQILYEMNLNSAQLAMLLQRGNADGVTLSLGSPYDEGNFRTLDYGFKYGCGDDANYGHACQNSDETMYFITATGLPKRVCNMLGDAVFGMAYYYDSEINGGDNECKDTDNTVTVFFDTDTTSNNETSQQPGNSDNPYTPTPEVTAATPTTATTLAPTTLAPTTAPTTLAPTTAPTTLAPTTAPTTYISSVTYSPTSYISTSFTPPDCGEHGTWCGSYCYCHVGWKGDDCNTVACSGNGYWDDYYNYCSQCINGYGGPDCKTPNMCEHGTWYSDFFGDVSSGYCSCEGTYGGTKCEIPNACIHGRWEHSNDKCVCSVGWKGDDCNTVACSGHGWWSDFNGGYCYKCTGGYGGPDCATPNMCNGNGTWRNRADGTGYCSCNSGWYGTYCDKCNGHGRNYDTSTGICTCYSAYSGNDCENG